MQDYYATIIKRSINGYMPLRTASNLSVSDSDANRTYLQTLLDACVATGDALLIPTGTWTISATGSGINRWCLSPTVKNKPVAILLAPGATLKIANSQVTDGNPVKLISLGTHTGGSYIGWPFGGYGGILDGNTANQAGWTGGYAQFNGNTHIYALDGSSNICIEGININNCFSNPVNIGGQLSYGGSTNINIRDVTLYNFGEGLQLVSCDKFNIDNVRQVITDNWNGDGMELSHCRYGSIKGYFFNHENGDVATQGGAGLDFYASREVSLTNFNIQGPVYPFSIETDIAGGVNYPDHISISNGTVLNSNAWFPISNGRHTISNVSFLGSNGSGVQVSKHYASGDADYSFEHCYWRGKCGFTVGDNTTLRMKNCRIEDSSTNLDGIFACGTCELDIDGLYATTSDTDAAIISLAANKTLTGKAINIEAPGVNDTDGYVFRAGANAVYSGFRLHSNSTLQSVAGSVAGIVGANYWEGSGTIGSADMPKGTKGQRIKFSGLYATTLNNGARLLLANASNVEMPYGNRQNHIILEYDEVDDKWFEVSRSFPTQPQRIISLPGQWTLSSPAANSTIEMGPAVYVTRASSLRTIDLYMGETNPSAGTATVEVRVWGTAVNSLTAAYLGASSGIRPPGTDVIAAGSKVQLVLVTSNDFAHNGTTITASCTLWE